MTRIKVPRNLTAFDRERVAKQLIEIIQERTDRGVDVNGDTFAPYSEQYAKSLDFQNAGKSKKDVNLQLTGDMLYSIEVLANAPGEIVLGYRQGFANDKAAGNQDGENGPARIFLGINEKELQSVLDKYTIVNGLTDAAIDRAAARLLEAMALELGDEDEE
jgi:hypothetical protein